VRFGSVPIGTVARRTVRVTNLGVDVARLSIPRPPPPLRCGVREKGGGRETRV
jgi:hypothetical protein